MGTIRRSHPLSLVLVAGAAGVRRGMAAAGEAGLYDQPVLTLDPGMHTATIKRADVSATGAYAVTGSDDKTVRLWDAPTGRLLRTIRLPQGPGHCGQGLRRRHQPGRGARGGGRVYRGRRASHSPSISSTATPGPSSGASTACPTSSITWSSRPRAATWRRRWGARTACASMTATPTGGRWRAMRRMATQLRRGLRRRRAAGDDELWTGPCASTIARSSAWRRPRPPTAHAPMASPSAPRATGWPSAITTRRPSRSFDGHALTPLPGPDTRGLDNGDLSIVAWSADGATLYAGGTYDRAGTTRWWRGPRPGRAPGASWPPAPTPS